MIRTLITFAVLMGVGMTSQAPLALSQGGVKAIPRDTAKLAAPVRGDFVVPTVNGMIRLLAVKRAVIAVDNRWRVAQLDNDASLLDSLLADEWTTTRPAGMGLGSMVQSKAHFLADVKSGERSYESIDDGEINVQIDGDDVVLTGRTTSQGYYKDQRTRDRSAFIRLYAQRQGRWQMIASRSIAIVAL